MHYPVWYLPGIGGGTLIALIAVFHVFISHFAVGGGLYLVLAEKKGLAEESQAILAFTKRHARFFLLTTMVQRSRYLVHYRPGQPGSDLLSYP